jgi:TPP-dependent pyruvate/acetoin dehydrogenase alpha subunit
MAGVTVDGTKPQDLYPALTEAVGRARSGEGPTFVEARAYRILAHSFGNDQSYQPKEEIERAQENEPVKTFRSWLQSEHLAGSESLEAIEREVKEMVEDAVDFAKSSSEPGVEELLVDVFASTSEVPV